MAKEEIQFLIEKAFEGIQLEDGTSILQTQVINKYGEEYTDEEFEALPENEITNDWRAIKIESLDKCEVAHLDDKGFRYYIPALMLSVLNAYHVTSSRVAYTLSILSPDPNRRDFWDYDLARYKILSNPQREAIAQFLYYLPKLITLSAVEQELVSKALQNYWKDYLPKH